jgi:uncharacterized membrane protein
MTCGGYRGESEDGHPLAPLVSSAVTAGTLLVAFGLLALGVESFWLAFVVGFGGVLPVSMGLLQHRAEGGRRAGDHTGPTRHRETDAALAALRERYARGEVTDEGFERQVEQLLATESVEGARAHAERRPDDRPAR